jgi:RNA polymerase sigma-70 factor (ECF subfamily)
MELRARGAETAPGFAASSDRHTMGENTALLLPEAAPAGAPEEPEAGRGASQPELAAGARALHLVPPDTFETFFEQQYTNLLKAMYLVTGNRHEAEEITQDAFVRALERWERVRKADNRAGYLYRIAVNLYRSKLRRLARGARKTPKPTPEADPFEAADDRDAVGRAMTSLSEGQREALIMVDWLGMTDEEAAAVLGISPVTVRVRRHRARANLRPLLETRDEEYT